MEQKYGMNTFMASEVSFVSRLNIGQSDSKIRSDLETTQHLETFGADLRTHTKPLTIANTADCMDDRTTLWMGDGTKDPELLKQRIAPQLPGGLVLAATKAAIAADLDLLRDSKNMKEAYDKVDKALTELGYEDGGHQHCGASNFVEASVSQPVPMEIALPTLGAIMVVNESRAAAFRENAQTKQQRLESGFFSAWDPSWHEDRLSSKVPQNFSSLDDEHRADGVYLMTRPGVGFAKNSFIEDTGQEAFGVTLAMAEEIASRLGKNEEEQDRLRVAFVIDLLDVSDKLIADNMPVFADAA